jgi:hypothetical protein
MKTWAIIRVRFEAMHHWPGAPDGRHDHLRSLHRHEFHVTLYAEQKHNDRDIEYLAAKDKLTVWLSHIGFDMGSTSCEMLAEKTIAFAQAMWGKDRSYRCEVSEDGENGALVEDYSTALTRKLEEMRDAQKESA